jgi:hypothetical protein
MTPGLKILVVPVAELSKFDPSHAISDNPDLPLPPVDDFLLAPGNGEAP